MILIYKIAIYGLFFLSLPFLPFVYIFSRKRRANLFACLSFQNNIDKKKNDETTSGDYYVSASEFNRDFLTNTPKRNNPGMPNATPRTRYDNQESRAPDMGGLSFNTYDWNFAPYMLDLKRKVERNIFPPPAFTRMGLISGESTIKFRIYPDGTMKALELIEYEGHKTLMETSYSAIKVSAPFNKLPADFPEQFLEVTAKFTYSNSKR